MIIGERIRSLRELKGLSQADIEKRSGLLKCYISRVENGHTVPSLDNLEKFSRALEVPLHELFYEGEEAQASAFLTTEDVTLQSNRSSSLHRLTKLFGCLDQKDQQFLIRAAERLSKA